MSAIDEIDLALLRLDRLPDPYRNAMTAGQLFLHIMSAESVDLKWIEQQLRRLKTRIYIVALPAALAPPGVSVMDDHPYWPYICVNSKEEAETIKAENGIDDETNLRHLTDCSFLVADEEEGQTTPTTMH